MTLPTSGATLPFVRDIASSPPAAPITTWLLTIWIGLAVELTFVHTPPIFGVVPTSGVVPLLKSSRNTVAPKAARPATNDRIAAQTKRHRCIRHHPSRFNPLDRT